MKTYKFMIYIIYKEVIAVNKVIDIFGNEITFDCMGCDIANHKLIPPGGYVYDDGFINVSADPEIPIEGFNVLSMIFSPSNYFLFV